jgi:hypothetical protein
MAEMTLLRRRMIEDMKVRNLSPATQRCYVHAVAKFAQHFNRSLDRIGLGRTSLAGGAQQCLVLENRRLALRYDRLGFIV